MGAALWNLSHLGPLESPRSWVCPHLCYTSFSQSSSLARQLHRGLRHSHCDLCDPELCALTPSCCF